jgi:predicted DCC family thiol-disulfide oxidoreductase YuxK
MKTLRTLSQDLWSAYTTDRLSSTAVLAKVATLVAILIHSVCLLPRYSLFYDSPWLDKNYAGLLGYPAALRLIECLNNRHTMLFFVVGEICSVVVAIRYRYLAWPLLPVIFYSTNLYHVIWAVQDGGNNLTHIYILILLMAVPTLPVASAPVAERRVNDEMRAASTNVAVGLMRLQLVAMYLCAGISKLQGGMWQNGTALFYIYQNEYFGAPWARQMVMHHPAMGTLGTYAAIVFQFSFIFLVWFRQFRYPLIAIGTLFHLGIAFTMNLHLFSLTMILSYTCMFDEDLARRVLFYIFPCTPLVLGFDETCRPCMAFRKLCSWMGRSSLLELDSAQRPQSELLANLDLDTRLSAICGFDGQDPVRAFGAVSAILRRTWVAPVLLPLIIPLEFSGLGDRLYRCIGSNRNRFGCVSSICSIQKGRR